MRFRFGGLVGAVVVVVTCVQAAEGQTKRDAGAGGEVQMGLGFLGDAIARIRTHYVEEPDDAKLIEGAVKGALGALDPMSGYINQTAYEKLKEDYRTEFGGLGMEVAVKDGQVHVVAPIDGTPAARAGIRTGDIISRVGGQELAGLTLEEAVSKMRGPPKTSVAVTLVRKGEEKPIELALVREVIRIDPVRSRAEGDVAYIRIVAFREGTQATVVQAVKDLKASIGPKLKGYVLDLRNSPGGVFDEVTGVCDAFLGKGTIVLVQGRKKDDVKRVHAKPGDVAGGKPMVVLIDGGTGSGSEIVAGALQDHKRATLIGTRSYGRGTLQTIYPFEGHGAIRLTTHRYYTPSNRSIEGRGIEPDMLVEAKAEGTEAEKAIDPAQDRQLQAALALLRGKRGTPGDAKLPEASRPTARDLDFEGLDKLE